jgi:lipoprotein NlpD
MFRIRTVLTSACVATTLAGCSSFVQQAAPVEAPAQSQGYRPAAQAVTDKPADAPVAQAVPYRADASLQSKRPAASPEAHPVSADDGKTHVVRPGENLFRIALSHGLKYQTLAAWNQMPDTSIKVGQVLRLTAPGTAQNDPAAAPVAAGGNATKAYPKALKRPYSEKATHEIVAQAEGSAPAAHRAEKHDSSVPVAAKAASEASQGKPAPAPARVEAEERISWGWPSTGRTLRGYSDSNKGVDIGGRIGQPVLASADGKVVYSGSGLRGYGKLIIIKHNKTFLSAYAHNSQLLVKEGQSVKKGQKIAEMGNTDADQVKLHFEIRRFGKPVDPMQYLNSKP